MRVAAVGDACIDLYPDGRWYASGNVVDTGVHLARLGIPTAVVTAVGDDHWGHAIKAVLAAEGVDTSRVHILPGKTAVTQMAMRGRERVHGDYDEGVLAGFLFDAADREFVAGADLVHTALWGNADDLLPHARAAGALISFDFADRLTHPLVTGLAGVVDYGFFSFAEPGPEADGYLQDRRRAGMRCAVGTFGEHGSRAFDGRFISCGIEPAEVENTVGAGDAYIAGFLFEVLQGSSVEQAMRHGAALAADVVSVFNPWRPAPPTAPTIQSEQGATA